MVTNLVDDLNFHDLSARHPGITPALGATHEEAACVCLDRHHPSPVEINIEVQPDTYESVATWQPTGEQVRAAWANKTVATEWGAVGIALAAVELVDKMFVVRRAETGTGADYYIASADTAADDLESCLRLEVSGIDRGDEFAIQQRVREKVRQTLAGQSNLPALAAVVGFRAKRVAIARIAVP